MSRTPKTRYTTRYTTRTTRAPKKKLRNRKRPNYLMLFGLFVSSALFSGLVSYGLQAPQLEIKDIRIAGVHLADSEAVEAAAEKALGQNIVVVNKKSVLADISNLPQVKQVKIGRELPDKMWIRIWERKADAIIVQDGRYFLTQDDGLVFHELEYKDDKLPIIEVADCETIEVGKKASSSRVQYALEVLRSGREEGLKLTKISVDRDGDMCLNMGSAFYVKLGQPDEVARKISIIRRALTYRPSIASEAVYIDVSCPSAAVWKPRVSANAAS